MTGATLKAERQYLAGAGNLHVAFCGSRGRVTAPGDPVRLMANQSGRHVVAACGEASIQSPGNWLIISFLLYLKLVCGPKPWLRFYP